MKYFVRANEGYRSGNMELLEALRYAVALRMLGNVKVQVRKAKGKVA